jgi:transposase
VFTDYYDESHHLTHRLKSCVDTFEYSFKELDPETGEEITTSFSVQEKRVVVYSPKLAAKQKAEILKMAEKASNCVSYKKLAKEELGDAVKYVRVLNKDKNGKKVEPVFEVDEDRLNEDLQYAGYNLLVTSETKMTEQQIYSAYHKLWKIEESFRITKSFLEARPVYVQKKETIYGHFLVCYLSLFLLRVLELKCFKGEISSFELIEFIRDFRVAELENGTFLNISRNQSVNGMIKKLTGNTTLDALYLDKKEIDNLFDSTMLFES